MTIPPESIEVGKCYLREEEHVRREIRIRPDDRPYSQRAETERQQFT